MRRGLPIFIILSYSRIIEIDNIWKLLLSYKKNKAPDPYQQVLRMSVWRPTILITFTGEEEFVLYF